MLWNVAPDVRNKPEYCSFRAVLPFYKEENKSKNTTHLVEFFCVVVRRTDSPLAKLYTTSTLEHHHFNHAVIILSTEVSDPKWMAVRRTLTEMKMVLII